ncbi:MAG: DUF58 domain-containing protein [bacterium]|nr:DUF58 domain-containing protein [bacterium]
MSDYKKYLDPQVVAKISNLELVARLVVEGFVAGMHKSPYRGFNVEFAEHRQYNPGDEIRYIDWRVWGKRDKYYVKQFEEETNLKCHIILDKSASMGYSSGNVSKLMYGVYLTSALSYLMLNQRDSVGLTTFDKDIRTYLPPRGQPAYLKEILNSLSNIKPEEKTDLSFVLHRMADKIKRRALIIVISDFMDDTNRVIAGMKHLRHKKHEVIVFHLMDPQEKEFNFNDPMEFVDMESNEVLKTDPNRIRAAYRQRIEEFIKDFKYHCGGAAIDYSLLLTSTPFDIALSNYLAKRRTRIK